MDGNKRTAVIYCYYYLIAHGLGLIIIPEDHVPEFKKKLVEFYESADNNEIRAFMKEKFWRKIKDDNGG